MRIYYLTHATMLHSEFRPWVASVDETIGALLVRSRDERGISQLRLAEQLCACAGVSTVTRNEVSRWERGERIPRRYWLAWLAMVLDLPVDQLDRAATAARRSRTAMPNRPPGWRLRVAGSRERIA
jgi:transcriptional regulator with XRE-family HTH domain